MILRGITKPQLVNCLDAIQDDYDNNVIFNNFEVKNHKVNTKGIGATDISGAVIVARRHNEKKGIVLQINQNKWEYPTKIYQNPFLEHQNYRIEHAVRDSSQYVVAVLHGRDLVREAIVKTPELVVDFLRNNENTNALSFTLRVRDSKGVGARRSWSGRRTVSACWHAHRDVMKNIFEINEHANLYTAMAHYKGKESFYELYPATGWANCGSQMQPACAEELCDC